MESQQNLHEGNLSRKKIKRPTESDATRNYISPTFLEYLNSTKLNNKQSSLEKDTCELRNTVAELKYMMVTMSESLHSILKVQKAILNKLNSLQSMQRGPKSGYQSYDLKIKTPDPEVNYKAQSEFNLETSSSNKPIVHINRNHLFRLLSIKHRDDQIQNKTFLGKSLSYRIVAEK